MKRIFIVITIMVVLIVSLTSTAFAGMTDSMSWDGTAKWSYISSDSVAQKKDPRLHCYGWHGQGAPYYVRATEGKSTNYISAKKIIDPSDGEAMRFANLALPQNDSVRRVHVEVENSDYYGISKRLCGSGELYDS